MGGSAHVTRTQSALSSRTTWSPSILGCLENICATSLRLGTTFNRVTPKTPSPDSKLVPGLVHIGRSSAKVHGLELDTKTKYTPEIGSRPGSSTVSRGCLREYATVAIAAAVM